MYCRKGASQPRFHSPFVDALCWFLDLVPSFFPVVLLVVEKRSLQYRRRRLNTEIERINDLRHASTQHCSEWRLSNGNNTVGLLSYGGTCTHYAVYIISG